MTDELLDMIDVVNAYRPWTMEYIVEEGYIPGSEPTCVLTVENGERIYKPAKGECSIDYGELVYMECFQSKKEAIDRRKELENKYKLRWAHIYRTEAEYENGR